jgi:hypothetical protein
VVAVLQIRLESQLLKKWFGCSVPAQLTLIELYSHYASRMLDNIRPLQFLFMRMKLTCSSPIEIPYYSTNEHTNHCVFTMTVKKLLNMVQRNTWMTSILSVTSVADKKPLISKRKQASRLPFSSGKKQKLSNSC